MLLVGTPTTPKGSETILLVEEEEEVVMRSKRGTF